MSTATIEQTEVFKTKIGLGMPCVDKRAGIAGHVYAINFNSKGCVEAIIVWYKDGERKMDWVDEARFVEENELTDAPDQEYRTHIILDHEYEDIQTGLKGWAAVVQFFDHMATRVDLRRMGEKDGMQKIVYNSVDDFLLREVNKPASAAIKAATPDPVDKKSPVIKEEWTR